ncbi:MAG TPA: hypothetical protein VIY49_05815 [Bryobacteraceae bacterium]
MAEFDFGEEIEAHLRMCPDCRALAGELRENAVALSAMHDEELPVVELASACNGGFSRRWAAVAAAAALTLLAIALPWHRKAAVIVPPSAPVVAAAPAPSPEIVAAAPIRKPRRKVARPKPPQPEETLVVRMLTPDPDIVIYWIVEPKEKSE